MTKIDMLLEKQNGIIRTAQVINEGIQVYSIKKELHVENILRQYLKVLL